MLSDISQEDVMKSIQKLVPTCRVTVYVMAANADPCLLYRPLRYYEWHCC